MGSLIKDDMGLKPLYMVASSLYRTPTLSSGTRYVQILTTLPMPKATVPLGTAGRNEGLNLTSLPTLN